MVNNQFIFANEKLEKEFIDDMVLRYTYPKTSTKAKNAGVKSNAQIFEKYFKGTYSEKGVHDLINRFKKTLGDDFSRLHPSERDAHKLRRQAKEIISQAGKRISGLDDFPSHHLFPIGDEFAHGTQDFTIIDKKTNSQLSGSNKKLIELTEQRTQLVNDVHSGKISSKNFDIEMGKLDKKAQTIIDGHYKKFPKHDGLLNWRKATSVLDDQGRFMDIVSKETIGGDYSKWAITDVNKQIKDLSKTELSTFRSDIKNTANDFLKQDLLKLAGTVNPKCRKGAVDGGRIGFQGGLSADFCINEGKKVARDLLAKNREGTLAQKGVMRRITSGVFNFAKSILDPKEFFNLKKQFFSKGAIASLPAFDAIMAFDDASRKNMDPKEAFAKTLTFGIIPRAMGFTDSIDVINAKKMLEDPSLSPAGKEYAQLIIDRGDSEKLSQTYRENLIKNPLFIPSGAKAKADTALANLKNKVSNASTAGRFDYEKLLTEKEAKDKAGEYVGEPHKVGPGLYVAFDGEEVRKVSEYGYARKGTTFDASDKPDVTPLVNKLAKKATSRGPMTEMKKQKIDYTPLTYENYKPFSFTKEEFEDTMRKVGALKEDQIYGDDYYQKTIETPLKASKKTEFMELPSFRGSQFSEGGITGLRSKYEYKK
jgi:hypothetical protein